MENEKPDFWWCNSGNRTSVERERARRLKILVICHGRVGLQRCTGRPHKSFHRTKVRTYVTKTSCYTLYIQKPRAQAHDNKSIVLDGKTNLHNICVRSTWKREKNTEEDVVSYVYRTDSGVCVYGRHGVAYAVSRVLYRNNVVVVVDGWEWWKNVYIPAADECSVRLYKRISKKTLNKTNECLRWTGENVH